MATIDLKKSKQPYFIAGAGELVSHVHRHENRQNNFQYRVNLFRIDSKGGVTNWLRPSDIRDIVKTCQVLAFSIADDGRVKNSLREQLAQLASELQLITDSWENSNA